MTGPTDPTSTPPQDPAPYELEPVAPAPIAAPPPARPLQSPSSSVPVPAKGNLNKEGVLTGFDEDADFDRDPNVDRALGKKHAKPKHSSAESVEPKPSGPVFITPGLGNAKVWSIVGGVLLISAVVAAAMTNTNRFASAFLTLYSGILHTGTGLIAVYFAARIDSRKVGDLELAAGRIATAVGAFLLLFNLNINLAGTTKWEELILATLAYAGIIAGLFRLWGRSLGLLLSAHFALWVVFQIGMQLSAWASAAPVVSSGAPR